MTEPCTLGQRGSHTLSTTTKRGRADMGSEVYIHTCTDACTPCDQDVGPEKGGWDMHTGHTFVHTYGRANLRGQVDKDSCTKALNLMAKMWDHMRDGWDGMYTQGHTQLHTNM